MAIDKPLLLACWKNTHATTLRVCTVETFNGGTPVDSVAIDLTLALNRDYWFSADGVADDADGNGDFLTIFCDTVISAVTEITNLVPSWSATGRLILTATLSGATTFNITFEDDTPTGFTAESWARLFGQDEADLEHASVSNVMTFANLSDRIWYVARPLHLDSRDRDNVVGSSSRALDGYAWASIQPAMFVTRTIGWANLKLEHVLNEYAETLVPTEPFNTAQNFRDVCVRYARRLRFYPDLSDLGTAGFGVYVPSEPIEDFVTQKDGDDQIFHDAKLMLVRESEVVVVEPAGDPPVINSFTLDASAGPIDVRAALLGTFAWDVTGATSLSIDNGVGTVTPVDTGTEDFTMIEGTVVYTLTATNAAGNDTATVTVNGYSIFDFPAYGFDFSYSGHELSGAAWPEEQGNTDKDLAAFGSNATVDVDTTGLTDAAIGAARVDKAVRGAAGSNAYRVTGTFDLADGEFIWMRVMVRRFDPSVSADYLFRCLNAAGTTGFGFRFTGVTGGARAFEVDDASSTQFNPSGFSLAEDDGYHLIDMVFRGQGGAGGVANMLLMVDGVEIFDTDHSENIVVSTLTGLNFAILGLTAGTGTPEYCDVLWCGGRFGSGNLIDLATHQLDAEAVGLYTPP